MDKEVFTGILAFVEGRSKAEGGYGLTPLLPATVEDTYHALRTLETVRGVSWLKKVFIQGLLKTYLASLAETPWISARTLFQVLYCASLADLALDKGKTMNYLKQTLSKTTALSERYYCARTLREVLAVDDMAVMRKARMVRFSGWRTARELWMKLYLRQGSSSFDPEQKGKMVRWLQACQNGDGGFGFLPGTTSYIENCHICTRALAFLNANFFDVEGCRHFVLACKSGNGGFARSLGSAPFLDATCHAVAAMNLLKGC
ncbi:MAG: hypothetical protein JW836_15190 [Deltaproteobacteria bacterium]|nr:hypothetical protein [Deltaproteobacteria bacterium]